MNSAEFETVFSDLYHKFSGGGTSKDSGKHPSVIESRDDVPDGILTALSEESFQASINGRGATARERSIPSSFDSLKKTLSFRKKKSDLTDTEVSQVLEEGAAYVLKEWITTIRSERDQLRQDKGLLNEKLNEEKAGREKTKNKAESKIEELMTEVRVIKSKWSEDIAETQKQHQTELKNMQEELKCKFHQQLGEEVDAHTKTKKELWGVHAEIESTTQELELKLDELAKLSQENASNRQAKNNAARKIEELMTEVHVIKSKWAEEKAAMRKQHQAELKIMEEELQSNFDRQLGEECDAHTKTKEELREVHAKIDSTTKELELRLEELAKLSGENAKNKQQLGEERDAHTITKEELRGVHAKIDATTKELELKLEDLAKLSQENAKNKQLLAKECDAHTKTKEELRGVHAKIESTTKQLELKLEELAKLSQENAKNKQAAETMKAQLEEMQWTPSRKSPFRKKKVVRRYPRPLSA